MISRREDQYIINLFKDKKFSFLRQIDKKTKEAKYFVNKVQSQFVCPRTWNLKTVF